MRVLFICLGNICRSPTAAGVLRALAERDAPQLQLAVDSAGTADYHIGEPADPRTLAAALARGYDLSAHRARQLERADFARFDLLLAMDRQNLTQMRRRAPPTAHERLRLFIDFAPGAGVPEVPDPYYGGPEDFERVIELVETASRGLIRQLQSSRFGTVSLGDDDQTT